jgi:predicted GNAT family acetyltransferase
MQFKRLYSNERISELVELINTNLLFGSCTHEYAESIVTDQKTYACILEGMLVGSVTLYGDGTTFEVRHLSVYDSQRGKGIAAKLLDILVQDNNVNMFAVGWTTPNGWDAEKLFMSRGFSLTTHDLNYWKSSCVDVEYCPHRTEVCNCSAKLVNRMEDESK